MDSFMLRDEAAKERIRLAEEFLDPRESSTCLSTSALNSIFFHIISLTSVSGGQMTNT